MRIKVCLPFYSEFEFAKPGLQELLNCKEHQFVVEPRQGVLAGRLRNSLIADKVSSDKHQLPVKGFDAFLTIDSDIGFTLKHVLKLISHDKDIVGCPYLEHGSDSDYVCGTFTYPLGVIDSKYDTIQRNLGKVDWMGSGMMLIKSHVFEKMEYPWYRHYMITKGGFNEETGEDIGFCLQALKANFRVWCDFDNPVQHKPRSKEDFNTDIHSIHQPERENKMQTKAQQAVPQIETDHSAATLKITEMLIALN